MTNIPAASDITFNEGLLRLAAVHGKTVEFSYVKGENPMGPIERRRLIPQRVYTARDGHLGFQGHDPDRDATRNYRIDRMRNEVKIA